jgi:prepilin-type N-terminal cleavage/methylation domain-containing protein
MRNRNGFSLVEVLVVISIILVLAAFLLPAFKSAKDSAHESTCLSNLHQLGIAVSLYRSDNNGEGVFGDMFEMGLPPAGLGYGALWDHLPVAKKLGICHGPGRPTKLSPDGFAYRYVPAPPGQKTGTTTWKEYVAQKGDAAILFMDENHNAPTVSMVSPFTTKHVIGLNLGNSVIRKTRQGDPWLFDWWD